MKKQILLAINFLACIFCIAQQADTVKLVTPFGKPAGDKVSVQVDKSGGTLASQDGKVELIIPPGALAKKTTISIHAVTNTMQPGGTKAYHLLPSGIIFRQPVQLIFHYTDEEQTSDDSELLGIAMQDEQGQWYDQADVVVDTVAKTISSRINHFSYWVNYQKIKLTPEKDRVKVNKQIAVMLLAFYLSQSSDAALSVIRVPSLPEWSVNSHKGGNEKVGTIQALIGNTKSVYYFAPASVPHQNPVDITAEFKNLNYKTRKKTINNLKVNCQVLVYDIAYQVNMEMSAKNTGYCNMGEAFDAGSFIVQFEGAETKVEHIKNNMMTITGQQKCECSPEWVNKATTLGVIHIAGVQKITVEPAKPPGFPHAFVQIVFKPVRAVFPHYRYRCPTGVLPLQPPAFLAYPSRIDFFANEEEQVILETSTPLEKIKITVRPLKED